jgi:hypothetical protein
MSIKLVPPLQFSYTNMPLYSAIRPVGFEYGCPPLFEIGEQVMFHAIDVDFNVMVTVTDIVTARPLPIRFYIVHSPVPYPIKDTEGNINLLVDFPVVEQELSPI